MCGSNFLEAALLKLEKKGFETRKTNQKTKENNIFISRVSEARGCCVSIRNQACCFEKIS